MNTFKKVQQAEASSKVKEGLDEGQNTLHGGMSDIDLDAEADLILGELSETAPKRVSEHKAAHFQQKAQGHVQKQGSQSDLSDRLALREQLLAKAPREVLMRKEIRSVLLIQKKECEAELRKQKHGKNYELLSKAVAQLRAVVHQLEDLAQLTYEALKEMWLRIVHRFASDGL